MNPELRDLLSYDPDTGLFHWKVSRGRAPAGAVAGYSREDGYVTIRVNGKLELAHRLAWWMVHGEIPAVIDHIDRDPHNNKIANLRVATMSSNQHNRGKTRRNSSGYKGVSVLPSGRWVAEIWLDSKKNYLGSFDTAEQAAEAYANAAKLLHGEFANTGESN